MKSSGSIQLLLLGVATFSVGAWLQPQVARTGGRHDSDSLMEVVFGEGRRMFANHFAVKADVYLHSGFYPSIFDQAAAMAKAEEEKRTAPEQHEGCSCCSAKCEHDHEHAHDHSHAAEKAGEADHAHADDHDHEHHDGDGCEKDFLGQPRDWIEAFGRHFLITEHSHLANGDEREILPWLRIAAELDPQRIETYTVGAYWLADRLNKSEEAERFLRMGLKANPQSYELLTELGKIYRTKDPVRAHNVWQLALRRWDDVEAKKEEPDKVGRHAILLRLAELEEAQGRYSEAVRWFEQAKPYSPQPAALDERIRQATMKFFQPTNDFPGLLH